MIWIVPIWLCLFLIMLGTGLWLAALLARVGGPSFRVPLTSFQLFWFGYAFTILFLEAYSLFFAIRLQALALLALGALFGFWSARRAISGRLRVWGAQRRRSLALGLIALIVVAVTAAHAAQPVGWYDTHLYHLQVVQWTRSYPAVPGIANLHYRLAYNNSIHLFAALADGLWPDRAAHLVLGLLASMVALQLACCALWPSGARGRLRAGYALLALPFVLLKIASTREPSAEPDASAALDAVAREDVWMALDRHEIASLSSDLPLALMCIVVVLELLGLPRASRRRADVSLAFALTLAAAATTTKLGGLGVLLVSAATALWTLRRRGWPRALWAAWAILPALLLVSYAIRQAVLSGWLLFPTPIGQLPFDWSLPRAETLEQFRWIESWARIPGQEPAEVLDHGVWHWLSPWLSRFAQSRELILLGLAFGLALLGLAQPKSRRLHPEASALAAVLLSLLLWFRGAPDLRFGAAFFWLLLAVLGAPLLARMLSQPVQRWRAWAVCLALATWTGGLSAELPPPGRWTDLPAPGFPKLRQARLSPGLEVAVPEGTDRCGNAPIPCTPYPAQQRARKPGDLRAGFLY